ncbi:MAG: hypothetical protein HY298_01075 [Verrucomicrobia bacterium]|nr:hypothetical protein [Verrucomicrobiota bacterium]
MKTYILRDPKTVEPQKRQPNPIPPPRRHAPAVPPPKCPGCGQTMRLIGSVARKPP